MNHLYIIPQHELPEKWYYQIISFQRIVWPEGFVGENKHRDWITNPIENPISIFLAHNDILISHVQVVSKTLTHKNIDYKFYGLTGVLTYPAFRKEGYGKQVVKEGMNYIQQQKDRDIVFYSCEEKNIGFYQKCDWQFTKIPVLEGNANKPERTTSQVAMEFVSEKAKQHQVDFETEPFYFGDELW